MHIRADLVRWTLTLTLTCLIASSVQAADCAWEGPTRNITIQTNLGPIYMELYPEAAPQTVAAFVDLAEAGLYDDAIFHEAYFNGNNLDQEIYEIGTGKFRYDADFEYIDLPPTSTATEACLPVERGVVLASKSRGVATRGIVEPDPDDPTPIRPDPELDIFFEPGNFDGRWSILVRSTGDPAADALLEPNTIVFGRLTDENFEPLDPAGDLGTAEIIGDYRAVDGRFVLEHDLTDELRLLPLQVPADTLIEDFLGLSDLASCFQTGSLGASNLSFVQDQPSNGNPNIIWQEGDPPAPTVQTTPDPIFHHSGPDSGKMVITNDALTLGCLNLLYQAIPDHEESLDTPSTYDCPREPLPKGDPEYEPSILWKAQPEARCSYADYDWEPSPWANGETLWTSCTIFQVDICAAVDPDQGEVVGFQCISGTVEKGFSCRQLALTEALLDFRRAETHDQIAPLLIRMNSVTVPEPAHPVLGIAAVAALAGLRRRRS